MRAATSLALALALAIALALALAAAENAAAQSWTGTGQAAGLSVDGGYTGLAFRCLGGGRAAIVFSGFPRSLQLGETYTVAVSVDGVASLFRTRAAAAGGVFSLVDDGSFASFAGLIDALRKGKSVEISGPMGRYLVPLRGSGKALGSFAAGCG